MSGFGSTETRDLVNQLEDTDLKYTEEFLKEIYKFEIDRKDKILSSMSVVSAPITILIAGVAYLIKNVFDSPSLYVTSSPDVVTILYYIFMILLFFCIVKTIYFFHKLLAGENYYYLPDADGILKNIADSKRFCIDNSISEDGKVSNFARSSFIMQYAESASKNCVSNDKRLRYRQGVFRNTILSIIWAGFGFVAVAIHREQPHIWNISTFWSKANGKASEQSAPAGATPTTSPAPSGNKQSPQPIAPASTSAPAGH